ncbi:MAG TPA: hypothetical protein VMH22_00690 [bacterium]|nr:hypothetical protein [bacterium]
MRPCTVLIVLAALVTLPGCIVITPKPPTPTLSGPDTGWTHTPTLFAVTYPSTGGWHTVLFVNWGDSAGASLASSDQPSHEYPEPGTYTVKCRLMIDAYMEDFEFGGPRGGDWSNPCTVHIVPGTLTRP